MKSLPSSYAFDNSKFLSKVFNQSKIKLTWDAEDKSRETRFSRLQKGEVDDEQLKDMIVASSDDSGSEKDERELEEYRSKLLGSLQPEDGAFSKSKRNHGGGDEDLDI